MSWRSQASCKGMDTTLFFPKGTGKKISREVVKACDSCPVLEQCREHAVRNEAFGYQGGMSDKERYLERRRLGIPEPEKNDDMRRTIQNRKGRGFHANDVIHGTEKGYMQEVKHNIPRCEECKKAHLEFMREYREKRRSAA